MTHRLLFEILLITAVAFAAGALFVRLRFPPAVGYLAAGVLIGPQGLNLLPESEGVHFLGELGVALLMFIIGLEFSLSRLWAVRTSVFGGGGLVVGLSLLIGAGAALLAGVGWTGAILLAGGVTLSSTAIVAKQLADQGELGARHGRLVLGVLLLEDLAALPFLVWIAALTGQAESGPLPALARAVLALVVFLAIAVLARRLLARFIEQVVKLRSTEIALLAILLVVLLGAAGAASAGLSLPIGAFLVGMMMGESDFRHQVEDDIRPFRDVLLGLFFITVGMAVDPGVIAARPLAVALGLVLLVGLKFAVVALASRLRGHDWPTAARAGLVLAHSGEFGLLILTQALSGGLLPAEAGRLALICVVLSMLLAPVLVQHNGSLVRRIFPERQRRSEAEQDAEVSAAAGHLSGHVLLCGCGRVGRLVATVLRSSGVPYLAIERDVDRYRRARDEGLHVVFGDATRAGLLHAAGVDRAAAVVALLEDRPGLLRLLHHVRRRFELSVPVIVSTRKDVELEPLARAGATYVFPENLAAGLALAAQALSALGLCAEEVDRRVETARRDVTPELRAFI